MPSEKSVSTSPYLVQVKEPLRTLHHMYVTLEETAMFLSNFATILAS